MKMRLLALALALAPLPAAARGVVASADPRATEAGREMLRAGGTAADAALAMMLALTVVEPQSSGIGGGGLLLHHDAGTGLLETIDGREKAPAAATPDRFLGQDGQPVGFRQAFPGGRSVGVPGNIRLAAMAHGKWGKLPWRRLFEPAIRLARDGFEVTPPLAAAVADKVSLWKDFPAIARIYTVGGRPVAAGRRITNRPLARLLDRVAREGPDAFYSGDTAAAIVAAAGTSRLAPGDLTLADLTAYKAVARPPVCGAYRGYTICGMGPPSSGATTVIGMLGMLERFDLRAMGAQSPVAWHLLGEAMRLAYADRDTYLADRDFVNVPVAGLIDPGYLAKRSRLIAADRTLGSYKPGDPPGAEPRTHAVSGEVPSTTHFVAVDKDGDVASMTSTVEGGFGSQLVAGGMVLNNELTDFSFAPEKDGMAVANRVQPGKRPLSSMSPTIVYDRDGKPLLALGSAGGRRIIMHVAKTLVGILDFGLSPKDAMALPNLYFDGDGLLIENSAAGAALAPEMAKLGGAVRAVDLSSKLTVAERSATGWTAAADPRSIGTALSE